MRLRRLRVQSTTLHRGCVNNNMDAIALDLRLTERVYGENNEAASTDAPSLAPADEETDGKNSYSDSGSTSLSSYQTSNDLATGTTVPVGNFSDGKKSTSSTSSSSSIESRVTGASLYMPEYLTPTISYDRQSPGQLLVALIGRAFDQPEKLASSLQELVGKLPNTEIPVAKFTPFTVRRKALCRGNFDSGELKKHDLICMCYNASEARILLTGQDGYYTTLLRQVEVLMGPNKVAFLISHYTPPHNSPSESESGDSPPHLLLPALRTRLSLQPALTDYLARGQVLSWVDLPLQRHVERLVEMARLEPNPQGLLHSCSVM